jgi:hypothetical protein
MGALKWGAPVRGYKMGVQDAEIQDARGAQHAYFAWSIVL